MLAGVSVDYYARLERGNLAGASESVLEAVAGALQLDDAERQHLFDLARRTDAAARAGAPSEARGDAAAGGHLDPGRDDRRSRRTCGPRGWRSSPRTISARPCTGASLDEDRLPVNLARYLFLDPHSRGFFLDWDQSPTTWSVPCGSRPAATPGTRR